MSGFRSILRIAFLAGALSTVAPAAAGAYATIAPPPTASPSSGLPDGRVYELASPFNKHGYEAGATGRSLGVKMRFSVASPNGDAVAFQSNGPAADTNSSGLSQNFVAERTSQGWTSRSTTARGLGQNEETSIFLQETSWLAYSPDLSHLAYSVSSADVPGAPARSVANYYLLGSKPLETPVWLLQSVNSSFFEGSFGDTELIGMSPDAHRVYFATEKHLLPEDSSRVGWGIYESRNGVVSEVGTLPDGTVPSSGAAPMATDYPSIDSRRQGEGNPASLDHQLSEDGNRVFYISAGQLYVHNTEPDGSEQSALVSASHLSGEVGQAAPDGVTQFENLTKQAAGFEKSERSRPTYGYASPDGSHVFFQTVDQLTEAAPAGAGLKVYGYNVDDDTLEYLSGVSLEGIVTAATHGTSFTFVSGASATPELDIWKAGPGGGSVTRIAQLPGGGFVGPGRMADHDSELVFQAQAPIPGFNNAGTEQIYRYEVATDELGCISCPPAGTTPSLNAYLSAVDQYGDLQGSFVSNEAVNDARGVSADGARIFFASPDPLVSRDTNGDFDTYEWENGTLFLISSGTGPDYSLFLDNSESGGDVFFTTSDELSEGDNDAAFDVYDARIPRPGDNPPPSAVPCSGDVCQGAPSVPQLLGPPPSATFDGVGNVVTEKLADNRERTAKAVSTAKRLSAALSACHRKKSRRSRLVCERQARRRYATAGVSTGRNIRRGK